MSQPHTYVYGLLPGGGRYGAHRLSRLNRKSPAKIWKSFAAAWVIEGRGHFQDHQGLKWPLEPGSLFLHYPDQKHRVFRDSGAWLEYSFTMDDVALRRLDPTLLVIPDQPVSPVPLRSSRLRSFESLHLQLEKGRDVFWKLCEWLREALESGQPAEDPWEEASRRLSIPPFENVENVIEGHPFSFGHFAREFKKKVGMSPGAFQRQARLNLGREMLRTGEQKVREVAEALGYSDPFIFSKEFRKMYGHPPKLERIKFRL